MGSEAECFKINDCSPLEMSTQFFVAVLVTLSSSS
jgi:hypothetical protein